MGFPRSKRPNRTRAVGYIRVSTDQQADRGLSLSAQRAKVRAYAKLHDIELVDILVDAGLSATTLERPGLQRALQMLRRREADAILVVALDRLTRSVHDLGLLLKKAFRDGRGELLSVNESIDTRSAAGRLLIHIIGSVAEWESSRIGERTSAAMRELKTQGRYTGGITKFGFELGPDGQHLHPVPREQAIVARARELRALGLTMREIALRLEVEGARGRSGRPLREGQVQRIVREEAA
ncbi:MAG: recombinase family protein [Polyangiaceae bacterium]|nr:recombinase family protein [Polyangiaceae bacterium]